MTSPVFHRFNQYGPVCGTRDGVNAADMTPPQITCRRCLRAPVDMFARWQTWRFDGASFVVDRADTVTCLVCGGGTEIVDEATDTREPCRACQRKGWVPAFPERLRASAGEVA